MQPLDLRAIDRIFSRMTARYGAAWVAKWKGLTLEELQDVRQDWAQELAGVRYDAIAYALGYLPLDFPPTVTQFRAICMRAPEPATPRLPAPLADPARVASIVAGIATPQPGDSKAWAYRLRDREKAGEKLSMAQRDMWRAVVKPEAVAV